METSPLVPGQTAIFRPGPHRDPDAYPSRFAGKRVTVVRPSVERDSLDGPGYMVRTSSPTVNMIVRAEELSND